MTPTYTLYGLEFPELVFFGILVYVAALIVVICFGHCIRKKTFCSSGECLHCTYINSKCTCNICQNCFMKQSIRSIFCCRRQHWINEPNFPTFPKCKIKCFKADCSYLRCFCCELSVERESRIFSVQKEIALNRVLEC